MWLLSRLIKDFERVSKAEARHTEPATAKWCPIVLKPNDSMHRFILRVPLQMYKYINSLFVFYQKILIKVIFWRPCRCTKRQLIGHRRK